MIWDARSKWYRISLRLNFREPDLAAIAKKFRDDPDDCLCEMVTQWLKQGPLSPPTWNSIVSALTHQMIGEKELARRIAQRLMLEVEDHSGNEADTMSTMTHSNEANIIHEFSTREKLETTLEKSKHKHLAECVRAKHMPNQASQEDSGSYARE